MKHPKIIIGLLLLSLGRLTGQSITFDITNFEAGPVSSYWMFDVDWTPFVYDNNATSQYAYSGLQWNADGHGDATCDGNPNPPGTGPGSGLETFSEATAEDLSLLEDIDNVTVYIDGFDLTHYEHINTVNLENSWDVMGEAGDYRIYDNGVGEIRVNDEIRLKLNPVVFYSTTYYPDPIGNGGLTGYAAITGQGNIVVEESDPDWVSELDPNNTGLIAFESNSMSPTIQFCYGAYIADLLVKPMESDETPPTAEFTSDFVDGDSPLTVSFTDLSSPGSGTITSWLWDFGDGGTSLEQNHVYTFESAGVYTVSITITDENGLSDIETKVDYITVTSPSDEDYFSFSYSGANMNGVFSVSGTLNPLNLPSDGTSGYYETVEDSATAIFSGIEAAEMDSINLAGIKMTTPGELVPGIYPIDLMNLSTVFSFTVGVSLEEFPEDLEDLIEELENLDAEAAYISASGSVTITEVNPTKVIGEFSGVMINIANPTDMLIVSDGEFSINASLVQYTIYNDGEYNFNYFGSNISGEFDVSGALNPIDSSESGVIGFTEFSEDTTTAVFAGIEVLENGAEDSLNVSVIYLNTSGELAEETYLVDVINGNAVFGYIVGVEELNLEDIEETEADKIYISGTGSITISAITDSTITGVFSGLMFNIENPGDMINVSNGYFFMSEEVLLGIDYSGEIMNLPTEFALKQNYPNPFNPMTTIEYEIQKSGFVSLSIYDIQGREVNQLVSEYKPRGRYSVTWDGHELSSGLYIYKLALNDDILTRKMLLAK